ncbi:MAG: glucan biosynthesis protein G [Pseudohongiella sp.]|uniref:glucan biosynthesis protein G n=1 Tax=Pseudohongiella sp. TaxID=1979412 RepID=UPI0034A07862
MQSRLHASIPEMMLVKRTPAVLASLILLLLPAWASAQSERFSRSVVIDAAQSLAETPFVPLEPVPDELLSLDYDQYRSIRYRKGAAIWGGTPTRFSIEFFAPGSLYDTGVDISIVENAVAMPIPLTDDAFEGVSDEVAQLLQSIAKVAGFRLHYSFNEEYQDEFVVFQGASYFRAVSQGQSYGLSARGLAIDVAEPSGEEFPVFREFWIERPSSRADSIVVHALLDSPRVTGAYRFGIYPGAPTRMDVEATLFARSELRHIGIGTLTSMYTFGSMDASDIPDYRSAVHDSNGLAMINGQGEHIWRPLNNPRGLQISAFMDYNPQGFGLMQRHRTLEEYQDLEANYHRRPSAWVRPVGNWGEGHVVLAEIPTPSEFNDNIVAYWRPATPLTPGEPFRFAYHMSWPDDRPLPENFGRVVRSAYGLKLAQPFPQMVIDYSDLPADIALNDVTFDATVTAGTVLETIVQPNHLNGARVIVTFDPQGADLSEIRVRPAYQGEAIGETWFYRWTGG